MERGISVLILAGGKSSRMGYPKAFLKIGNATLIESILDTYSAFSNNMYVAFNHEFATHQWQSYLGSINTKANVITNYFPEKGRFYSIKLGLAQITDSNYCFIHNVDNPLKLKTIQSLIENKNEDGYTVPSYNHKNGHPILISNKIIGDVLDWEDDNTNWKDFLGTYSKKIVATDDPNVLINLNTPDEYEDYLQVNGAYLH